MSRGADQVAGRPGPQAQALLIAFVLASALLADRAYLTIATGGRGALPLLPVLAPLLAVWVVARRGVGRSLTFMGQPLFVLGVAPYLALAAVLPVLGVLFTGYPERTLLSLTESITALSFVVIGAALSSSGRRAWGPWLLLALAIQLAYAAGQAVYLSGGPGSDLFTPFHEWDLSLQDLDTFVQARGTGLYLNPNELGSWAAVGLVLSLTLLRPRLQTAGLTLAFVTLLLSQSRGAGVAAAAAVVAGVVIALGRGRIGAGASKTIGSAVVAATVAFALAFVLEPSGGFNDRFASLLTVWTEGPRADANLAGRLDFWAGVTTLNASYPWGTLGSPELLLGTSIDSSWFRAFAQGSVAFVTALGVLIAAALSVPAGPHRDAIRLVAVVIAVAGITQTPFGYPVIVLFWTLLGAGIGSEAERRHTGEPLREPSGSIRRALGSPPKSAPGGPA